MKFTLTSPSGTVIDTDSLVKMTVMTETWEITVLPDHEPLLSVVRPGILQVTYTEDWQQKTEEYAVGWWVIHIDDTACTLVSDLVQWEFKEDDLADIEAQKKEAEELMRDYAEWKTPIDPKRQMEIEYDLLRHQARYELWKHIKTPDNARK